MGNGCIVYRLFAQSLLALLAFLGSCAPTVLYREGKAHVLGVETVLIGRLTLEGTIPSDSLVMKCDMTCCVKQALATVAEVPPAWISMSRTDQTPDLSCMGQCRDVAMFHFVLLPKKGLLSVTGDKIQMASTGMSNTVVPILQFLAAEMTSSGAPLVSYTHHALQYKTRMDAPRTEQLDILMEKDYGDASTALQPTTAPAGVTSPPNLDACTQMVSACKCADLGGCKWAYDTYTSTSSCANNPSGASEVGCESCKDQAKCHTGQCTEVTDACECAQSAHGCRWDQNICKSGTGTSCASCARQSSCEDQMPKVVQWNPLNGAIMNLSKSQIIHMRFDKDIAFGVGTAPKLACEPEAIAGISRNRMTIDGPILLIDIEGPLQALGNMPSRCSLVVEEGFVKSTFGVSYLGLPKDTYSVNFGDSTAPKVITFRPRIGEKQVETTTVVTLTFSEPIKLNPNAGNMRGILSRYEGDSIYVNVGDLQLKEPDVRVDEEDSRKLKVDFGGRLEAGFRYSFSLPSGSIADHQLNNFGGLSTGDYYFKTLDYVPDPKKASRGLSLTSFLAVGFGLILVLGIAILTVWWFGRLHYARKRILQQVGSKQWSEPKPAFAERTVRTSKSTHSVNTTTSTSRKSTTTNGSSIHSEEWLTHAQTSPASAPAGQAPLDEAEPADPFKAKMRRSETWAPGKDPGLSGNRRASEPSVSMIGSMMGRGGSKESVPPRPGSKERAKERSSSEPRKEATVKSVREAAARQQQQRSEATKLGHAKYAAKRAAASPPGSASRPSVPESPDAAFSQRPGKTGDVDDGPFARTWGPGDGPRGAADAWADPRPAESEGGPSKSKASTASTATGGTPTGTSAEAERGKDGKEGRKSSRQPSGGAKDAESKFSTDPTAVNANDAPELRRLKQQVEKQLKDQMEAPIADRKKVMKALQLEYHPDKNSSPYAKEVFQYINASKGWFLCEA